LFLSNVYLIIIHYDSQLVIFAKYNQNDQVKEAEIGRMYSMHGKKTNACRVLVGKPKGKILLGRHSFSWRIVRVKLGVSRGIILK
jgi:hypothetical protein